MSGKRIIKSGINRAKEVLAKVDSETFKKISAEFLSLHRKGTMVFDVLPTKTTIVYSEEVRDRFLKEFNVNEATFSELIEATSNVIHNLVDGNEERFLEQLKPDEELIRKVKSFYSSLKGLEQFQEIKNRFQVVSRCKTKFIDDLDWEISLKYATQEGNLERKTEAFPFCVLRLFFKTTPSAHTDLEMKQPEVTTIELSLFDATRLVQTFSEIRDRMKEAISEKSPNGGT